jgi:light-harvesting complex I chlorophyll a/b binding protein 1
VFPGGRFDPLNFSEGKEANFFGEDLDTLKIKELKHCRLAMLAWLGILAQSVSTNPGGAGPDAVGPSRTGPRTSPTSCTATSSTAPGACSESVDRSIDRSDGR